MSRFLVARRRSLAAVVVLAAAVPAAGCGAEETDAGLASTASVASSAAEVPALTYLAEEEKLARDVYAVLAGSSGDRRFVNIGASESRHLEMVRGLLSAYGAPDPTEGRPPGEFADATLQRAYDDLVERGTASPEAALEAGRTIERMDIEDLDERRAEVVNPDVLVVLDALRAGSERHLAAFSR